jgi:acetylornithine/succinyldiaminopimelate/putrescine aminotransferase
MTQAVADAMPRRSRQHLCRQSPGRGRGPVVVGKISGSRLLEHVRWAGSYLEEGLGDLQQKYPHVREIRGRGLIYGIAADLDVAPAIQACFDEGMLVCKAGNEVLRLLPPLVVQQADLDESLAILDRALARL